MSLSFRKPFTALGFALLLPFAAVFLNGCQKEPAAPPGKPATTAALSADPATELAKAHDGDARAQLTVGLLYLKGEGVPQDNREARFWIEKAARQGLDDAEARLGTLYLEGLGAAPDLSQAKAWLEKAAARGHAEAQTGLAKLLLSENPGEENLEKARHWLKQASRQGHHEARRLLSGLSDIEAGLKTDAARLRAWLTETPPEKSRPPEEKTVPQPSGKNSARHGSPCRPFSSSRPRPPTPSRHPVALPGNLAASPGKNA